MRRCIAARRDDMPCPSLAMRGHSLCLRHARMRTPTIWTAPPQTPIITFQAIVRGWLVRKWLRTAGPGALSRKNLANEEDFATCLEMSRVSPLEYFGFEENGKRWGFLFESLWRWSIRSLTPTNPYTKVPLSKETRIRLRTMWITRFRHGVGRELESDNPDERTRYRWTVVCQHFTDSGFLDVSLESLLHLSRVDLATMFVMLERDLEVVLPSSDPFRSRLLGICRRRAANVNSSLCCANSLLYMLSLPSNPYALTFSILSALYRC